MSCQNQRCDKRNTFAWLVAAENEGTQGIGNELAISHHLATYGQVCADPISCQVGLGLMFRRYTALFVTAQRVHIRDTAGGPGKHRAARFLRAIDGELGGQENQGGSPSLRRDRDPKYF